MRPSEKIVDEAIEMIGSTPWYSAMHRARFIKTVDAVGRIRATKKQKILELGTWPGYLAVCFFSMGYETYGIDLDPGRLEKIKDIVDIKKLDLNVSICFPFPDDFFDVVSASEILEHIRGRRLPDILKEIRRVLKPGGAFLITTPNRLSFGNVLRIRKKSDGNINDGHGHFREYGKMK